MAVFMAVFMAYKKMHYFPIKYDQNLFMAFLAYIPFTPKYISTPHTSICGGDKGGGMTV